MRCKNAHWLHEWMSEWVWQAQKTKQTTCTKTKTNKNNKSSTKWAQKLWKGQMYTHTHIQHIISWLIGPDGKKHSRNFSVPHSIIDLWIFNVRMRVENTIATKKHKHTHTRAHKHKYIQTYVQRLRSIWNNAKTSVKKTAVAAFVAALQTAATTTTTTQAIIVILQQSLVSEIIIAATLQTIFFGQLFSSLCEYLSEWLALWRRTSLPVAGVADSRQTATAVAKAAPLGVCIYFCLLLLWFCIDCWPNVVFQSSSTVYLRILTTATVMRFMLRLCYCCWCQLAFAKTKTR